MTTLEIYAAALLMGSIVLVFVHICLTKPAHLLECEWNSNSTTVRPTSEPGKRVRNL